MSKLKGSIIAIIMTIKCKTINDNNKKDNIINEKNSVKILIVKK